MPAWISNPNANVYRKYNDHKTHNSKKENKTHASILQMIKSSKNL